MVSKTEILEHVWDTFDTDSRKNQLRAQMAP
ncbi:hypothetical protein AB0M44_48675 [Streptosporangium subroseum]